MKGKIIWTTFWILIAGAVCWSVYTVTPYVLGEKNVEATKEEAPVKKKPEESPQTTEADEEIESLDSENASGFISWYHRKMNEFTGWNNINNPRWDDIHSAAKSIVSEIDAMGYKENADLVKDFEAIRNLAKELETNEDKGDLRTLHRYFHDLDVVMNDGNGEGKYYGVTAWGEANKQG